MKVIGMLGMAVVLMVAWTGAVRADEAKKPAGAGEAEHSHGDGHKTAHGGCLNAIEECEVGHAEIKIDGAMLKLWFVGGGQDTQKSVRVPDPEVVLTVTAGGQVEMKSLTLKARPNELAEEKVGDCSRFEGTAEWLKGVKKLSATGTVTFKGKQRPLRIEYPAGYDPDDDNEGSESVRPAK